MNDADGMSIREVLQVLAALRDAGCRVWVEGGWGVDALVGRQTRPHRDLDLAFDAHQEATLLAVLAGLGYGPDLDLRPVRMELRAGDDGRVDIHPLVFDALGNGVQAGWDGASYDYPRDGFSEGSLEGQPVPCLTVDQQTAFHAGYAPRDLDRHDLATLAELRSDHNQRSGSTES